MFSHNLHKVDYLHIYLGSSVEPASSTSVIINFMKEEEILSLSVYFLFVGKRWSDVWVMAHFSAVFSQYIQKQFLDQTSKRRLILASPIFPQINFFAPLFLFFHQWSYFSFQVCILYISLCSLCLVIILCFCRARQDLVLIGKLMSFPNYKMHVP